MSKILVIGAQNIDIFTHNKQDYQLHDSNITDIKFSFGGVGRNIAENINRLDCDISFLTVFGNDIFSKQAQVSLEEMGIQTIHSKVCDHVNSVYIGILDKDNDLYLGLNDMKIVDELDTDFMIKHKDYINQFDILVIDNNLPEATIKHIANTHNKTIIMDAVSAHKVHKLRSILDKIDYVKLNHIECIELTKQDTLENQIKELRKLNVKTVIITNQDKDITVLQNNVTTYKTIPCDSIINASGAGDGFISGFIKGVSLDKSIKESIDYAKKVAYITLLSDDATNKDLTYEKVKNYETIYRVQ